MKRDDHRGTRHSETAKTTAGPTRWAGSTRSPGSPGQCRLPPTSARVGIETHHEMSIEATVLGTGFP